MVSRDDVARHAGVSGATVSYVLNDTPGVSISEKTRQAVLRAAAELGYRPSLAGRALRLGRLHQIGVVAPSGDILFSAYHEPLLRAIWRAASQNGYRLLLDALRPSAPPSFVSDHAVDAIITMALPPSAFPLKARRLVRKQKIPVVMIGGGSWAQEFHTLDIDNIQLGETAAEYLIARGHRRFLLFGGQEQSVAVFKRRQGFRKRVAAHGLPEPALYDTSAVELDDGYRGGLTLLSQRRDFTAAFCYNDNTALGLLRAAGERGIRIPVDLSILGVDAAPVGQYAPCRLASFRQPLDIMGEEAVRLILSPLKEPVHRYFPFELIEGESITTISK